MTSKPPGVGFALVEGVFASMVPMVAIDRAEASLDAAAFHDDCGRSRACLLVVRPRLVEAKDDVMMISYRGK